MDHKRVQKSDQRSPQQQESAIAPVGARSHSPSYHVERDMETQEIQQHKHEATILEIQAKYGTITPQKQERLTFLQAKMADYTQRKLDFGKRVYQQMFNSSGGDVSVTPPERKTAPPIQAKLTIGQPGDKYEQEADRVAAQVVRQIHAPTTQREALPDEENKLQMKSEIGSIQRQTMPEDEELQMKSSGAGMTAPQDLETSIQQARGSGQSLADSIKQPMEQAFGADFSGVKVHTDARSDQLNQSIQARAFTTGQDVFFRQGEYNPGSRGGQELIAHELTHVVQQNGGAVQRAPQPPDKEKDAKRVAVATQISSTLRATGLQVFLGGAAAATLVSETRQINDLDFRIDNQERKAFSGESGDRLKKKIDEALGVKTEKVPGDTTIRGKVQEVEFSITSEPSTEKTLSRGEAHPGLESIGEFAILLEKALAAANRPKNKSDSVATDVYDIIKVRDSLPGGGKGILNHLDSYWKRPGLAVLLIERLKQLESTASKLKNPYSKGRDLLTKNKLMNQTELDTGIAALIKELAIQKEVNVL